MRFAKLITHAWKRSLFGVSMTTCFRSFMVRASSPCVQKSMGIVCVAFHEMATVAMCPFVSVCDGPRFLVWRDFMGLNGRYLTRLANGPRPHGFVIRVMKDYGHSNYFCILLSQPRPASSLDSNVFCIFS